MNEKQIFEKLQKIISETLGKKNYQITLNVDLVQELGADSLDLIDIFYQTEGEFHIKMKTSAEEDSFFNKFLQNPTPKTLMDFAKNNARINMNKKTQALNFLQNPKSFYQR